MDTAPDPRPDLTAAQRIAIALGTAEDPRTEPSTESTPAADPEPELAPGTPA